MHSASALLYSAASVFILGVELEHNIIARERRSKSTKRTSDDHYHTRMKSLPTGKRFHKTGDKIACSFLRRTRDDIAAKHVATVCNGAPKQSLSKRRQNQQGNTHATCQLSNE